MSRIPVTSLLLLVSVQAKGFKRGIGGPVWRPLCLEAANGARLMRRWEKMGDDGISTFRPRVVCSLLLRVAGSFTFFGRGTLKLLNYDSL